MAEGPSIAWVFLSGEIIKIVTVCCVHYSPDVDMLFDMLFCLIFMRTL